MSGEKDLRAELRRRIADARSEVAARIEAGDPYTDGAELDADLFEAAAAEIDRLTAEVERLRGWKADALAVMADEDRVWEAAGRPGPLGASKSECVIAEIGRLRAALAAAHDELPWCECRTVSDDRCEFAEFATPPVPPEPEEGEGCQVAIGFDGARCGRPEDAEVHDPLGEFAWPHPYDPNPPTSPEGEKP